MQQVENRALPKVKAVRMKWCKSSFFFYELSSAIQMSKAFERQKKKSHVDVEPTIHTECVTK